MNRAPTTRNVGDLFLHLGTLARRRFVEVALEFDLTPPQLGALMHLDDNTSMSGLAGELGCDASNITWMTDRLEERGLVERRPSPMDRRVKYLVLTESGRRLRKKLERRVSEVPEIDRLTADEQHTLAHLLAKLVD